MQALLLATSLTAGFVSEHLPLFLGLMLLMNLCAATMDIAVDGLAVDLLAKEELGHGNASQVVGYKVGMLTGGGLLAWLTGGQGFRPLLIAVAGLIALAMVFTLFWKERPVHSDEVHGEPYRKAAEEEKSPEEGVSKIKQTLRLLKEASKRSGTLWVLLYIATYKSGETLVDVMFKPFLIDAGVPAAKILLWIGTYGMVASLLGSLLGGWAASRGSLWLVLVIATVLRAGPVWGEWWLAAGNLSEDALLVVTIAEHFFGGLLTTVVFTFMMSQVDPRIGGSHFTLLATFEVLGKAPMAPISGVLAFKIGYAPLFALGTLLSLLVLLTLVPLRKQATLV